MYEKIGVLVDEKDNLVILSKEQIDDINFLSDFAVFTNGIFNRSITEVNFLETNSRSGEFDYFGLNAASITKVLDAYDKFVEGESLVFRTINIKGYSDSETKISRADFEAKNLKITLKVLTQEQKINFIKSNFNTISGNYKNRFN
jgi:hypothetical protein